MFPPLILHSPLNAAPHAVFETRETDTAWLLRTDLPGVREQDLTVEILGDQLVISGQRYDQWLADLGAPDDEVGHDPFRFQLTLPAPVDPAAVSAALRRGVLMLTVAKPASAQPHRITVVGDDA